MSDKVQASEINKYFKEYFNSYVDDITDDVIEATDQICKEAKQELIETSPRSRTQKAKPLLQRVGSKTSEEGKTEIP